MENQKKNFKIVETHKKINKSLEKTPKKQLMYHRRNSDEEKSRENPKNEKMEENKKH